MAYRKIGQIFVDMGFITDEQLEQLLDEQDAQGGELLGKVAVELGLVKEDQLYQALGEQFGMPLINLADLTIPVEVLSEVADPMAQMYRIIPIALKDDTLTVGMCDPQNISTLDELRTFLGYDVRGVVATESDIVDALDRYYSSGDDFSSIVGDIDSDDDLRRAAEELNSGKFNLTDAEALAESAPVRKLLNMILLLAIKDQASDIHLEPFEMEFKIRVKADGVLYEMVPPPRHLAVALVTRVKVMSNMDIAERRMPQDGRIELVVGGHPIDMRVSVLPTMFGESVVMRILDRSVVNLDLTSVGMDTGMLDEVRKVIRNPNGIVLVTGPTGSGKTTTLYAALSELNDIADKIITTEEPVEYDIEGIIQCPIDAGIGVTFASCLRAILRQDPDIVLVGEIRDYETAEIAVQASLTGHLVFSTLHTNDAPSTITRLRDMGVAPFMIAATVRAVLAQRLVRRICANCKEPFVPSAEKLAELQLTPEQIHDKQFFRGAGCDECSNGGYKGRIGLFELMDLNDDMHEMLLNNCSTDELRDAARGHGMIPLREAGMKFVYEGITTIDEIVRETIVD
ncbi:MAG: ATPase, T2SS/T4P/T4SS family [Planctomycetales bacterium]